MKALPSKVQNDYENDSKSVYWNFVIENCDQFSSRPSPYQNL